MLVTHIFTLLIFDKIQNISNNLVQVFPVQQILQPGGQPDCPLQDPLGREAVPVQHLQQEVLPVQLRHHSHEDTQRGQAVQVTGIQTFICLEMSEI